MHVEDLGDNRGDETVDTCVRKKNKCFFKRNSKPLKKNISKHKRTQRGDFKNNGKGENFILHPSQNKLTKAKQIKTKKLYSKKKRKK